MEWGRMGCGLSAVEGNRTYIAFSLFTFYFLEWIACNKTNIKSIRNKYTGGWEEWAELLFWSAV